MKVLNNLEITTMKKKLTYPQVFIYHVRNTEIITGSGSIGWGGGENDPDNVGAPTRQTTDFFGNTILVPIDDDWE